MEISINTEQGLYVLSHGHGYSCWGFENAFEETAQLAGVLSRDDLAPSQAEFGTLAIPEKHKQLLEAAKGKDLGTWFNARTPKKVRKVLEQCRKSGDVVRIFLGDVNTGRSWMEEHDTIGRIGRSCGLLKVPLLVPVGDIGGPAILDANIIRISRVHDGKVLYSHPSFHVPLMFVEHTPRGAKVFVDGVVRARFATYGEACHWVAFMSGDCNEQP